MSILEVVGLIVLSVGSSVGGLYLARRYRLTGPSVRVERVPIYNAPQDAKGVDDAVCKAFSLAVDDSGADSQITNALLNSHAAKHAKQAVQQLSDKELRKLCKSLQAACTSGAYARVNTDLDRLLEIVREVHKESVYRRGSIQASTFLREAMQRTLDEAKSLPDDDRDDVGLPKPPAAPLPGDERMRDTRDILSHLQVFPHRNI